MAMCFNMPGYNFRVTFEQIKIDNFRLPIRFESI